MSILELVAVCLAAWCALSVPLALLMGRAMHASQADAEREPAPVLLFPSQGEGLRRAA